MADLISIKKAFLDIYTELFHVSEASLLDGLEPQRYPCFKRLDRMAAMEVDDQEAEALRQDVELKDVLAHISRMKRANGLGMEIDNAKAIISAPSPWDLVKQFVYYPNYLELARMEYTGGRLSAGNRVVFLGSGPLPLTLISLCTRYNVQGIGIEQCAAYADLSREVIKTLGLTAHIRIMEGNHFSLPLPQVCHLLMIGADALPKETIFSHLATHLENGTRLTYRIYEKGLRRLLDVQSHFHLPPEFKEYTRIRPKPPVNNTSVFVERVIVPG